MPKYEHITKVVDDLCLRTGDRLRQNRMLYMNCAVDVWNDLNDTTLKIAKRVKIPIRKIFSVNKKTNSIDIPCDSLRLCSVNLIDECGVFYPVYRNDKLHDDIVDIGAARDCACENKCNYKLCNTIKGYEGVTSTKSDYLPNGSQISFECTDRKAVVGGVLYTETQYPLRVYVSGVWVDTIKHTEQTKMCDLDVDDNGCVCDTEKNINAVCNSCFGKGGFVDAGIPVGGTADCPPRPSDDTWIYYCNNKMDWFSVQCGGFPTGFRRGCENIYNISELGNRIVLPANFAYKHVMVRYYEDINLKDLQIPYIAKETFMTGLQYFATTNHEKKQQIAEVFGQKYSRQKWGLLLELNKYRIAELKMILTPPIIVPSYAPVRGYFGDGYQFYF